MMAGFSLIASAATCAVGLIFFSVCYLPPPPAAALSFDFSTISQDDQRYIRFEGNASFGVGCIDITTDSPTGSYRSMGRASYMLPVQLWNASTGEVASFTTSFSFNITPRDINNKGDGMAFFLVSYPSRMPDKTADGGTLGLTSKSYENLPPGDNRFVAVEFDTFNNPFDPHLTYDHIGIDVNSVRSVKNESLPSFSLIGNMTAIIDYDSSSSNLSVKLWTDGSATPYNLSSKVDLKSALPEKVAVGFSAATGASVELHQLYSWYFNSSFEQKQPTEVSSLPPPQQSSPTTSAGPGSGGVSPPLSPTPITLQA